MKKIHFLAAALLVSALFFGCTSDNKGTNPGPAGPAPLLIDDCEDGNSQNLLGGSWYAFDDVDLGLTNANSNISSSTFMASGGAPGSTAGCAKITNQLIFTSIVYPPSLQYGFTGMYTTVTYAADISAYSGISFYAYSSVSTTSLYNKDMHFSFALGSQTEQDQGIKSRYRKEFVITAPLTWQQFNINFAELTQGFAFDSFTGSHPQTVSQILTEVRRFEWDMYAISASGNSQWSDDFMIDMVQLY